MAECQGGRARKEEWSDWQSAVAQPEWQGGRQARRGQGRVAGGERLQGRRETARVDGWQG